MNNLRTTFTVQLDVYETRHGKRGHPRWTIHPTVKLRAHDEALELEPLEIDSEEQPDLERAWRYQLLQVFKHIGGAVAESDMAAAIEARHSKTWRGEVAARMAAAQAGD